MIHPLVTLSPDNYQTSKSFLESFVKQLGLLGPVFLHCPFVDADMSQQALDLLKFANCFIEGIPCSEIDNATTLLDSGMQGVFFRNSNDNNVAKELLSFLPRNRVGISSIDIFVSSTFLYNVVQEFRAVVDLFVFKFSPNESFQSIMEIFKGAKALVTRNSLQIYFLISSQISESELVLLSTVHECIHVVFESSLRVLTKASRDGSTSASQLSLTQHDSRVVTADSAPPPVDFLSVYISSLRSDRADGLYTTVVCDDQGVCLGLVYSNADSIRHAVSNGRGVYWSRSRGELWMKGETSGMWQELLQIDVDCDRDALRFTVKQHGDPPCFCHLETRTCWGGVKGLQQLESILRDRKKHAPEGSYTKKMFDNPAKLREKLLEEVQELVEATDPDHVAAEAADVLYFTMTRCVAAGVGFSEIESHLNRRTLKVTRRPGDTKAWRTKAAEEALTAATSSLGQDGSANAAEKSSTSTSSV